MSAPGSRLPIRLVVSDDLRRARITVFLRLLLAIPHLVWFFLWSIAAFTVVLVSWLAVLIERRVPKGIHDFLAGFVRYSTHLGAYLTLAASPFPGFRGAPGYPVDVEIDPPEEQSRWSALFRLVLVLPALFLAVALGGALNQITGAVFVGALGVAGPVAFLAWFACLVRGRMPHGMRDLAAWCLGYSAQTLAYLLLVTGRYPFAGPDGSLEPRNLPEHAVRLTLTDRPRRARLLVLLRLPLLAPHIVWLVLWSVLALAASVLGWLWALVAGRLPAFLHRFLAAYIRYRTHFLAFATVVGGPFPGFVGRQGSYPVDVEIEPATPQRRLVTLFRLFLALPAFALAGALSYVYVVAALLGWWASLVTGRMPAGLHHAGAIAIRYEAQLYAYLSLVTARYPYSAPWVEPSVTDEQLDLFDAPPPAAV